MDGTTKIKGYQLPILRLKTESGSEDVHYPAVYDGFPQEFKLFAEKKLNETEEKRINGIQMLKDHIKRKNLHSIPDYLLLAVLRVSKYDMKKSKSKLENFLKKRKEIVDLVLETGLDKLETVLDNFSVGILPYRDKHGSFLIFTRPDGFERSLNSVDDLRGPGLVMLLFMLQFPISTISGLTYFLELKQLSVTYVYPCIKAFKRIMWIPLSLPLRVTKLNVLNAIPPAHWFYNTVKHLVPQKILKREKISTLSPTLTLSHVSFYPKGYDMFAIDYNADILPEEFGGNTGPLNNRHYKHMILDFVNILLNEYQ